MAANNEAQIWGVMAASGSGKGVWLKQWLRKAKPTRLVIYDYKDEYGEFVSGAVCHSLATVRQSLIKAGKGACRVRFASKKGTPTKQLKAEFEGLCRLVQAWENTVFLAEELSNVTSPSWAPPAWREMTTGGRHEGVHIIGVAQNPALIDKTFLSNCTMVHVGNLREYGHRLAVARSIGVPMADLEALQKFEWIEHDFNTKTTTSGKTYPPNFKK